MIKAAWIAGNSFGSFVFDHKNIKIFEYPSDLTDRQWQVMEKTLCSKRKRGNPLRAVINALLYITKSGCQWRILPKEHPLWQSVYYYSGKWKRDGTLEEVHDTLASDIRKAKGKKIAPSVGIIDSQSAKRSALGLLMVVVVHAANVHDSVVAAKEVFQDLRKKSLRGITKVFADGGYRGAALRDRVAGNCGWALEIIKRNDAHKFKVLPKRWMVERTFAWISFQRRTSKDHERLTDSSIAFIQLSMVRAMLNKFK